MSGPQRSLIACCCAALLFVCGCSSESGPPPSAPAKAAEKLKTAFSAADARIQKIIETASTALKEKKYETAYFALEAARAERTLTPEQSTAVQESMQSLQTALSEAVVRGD